MDRRCCQDSIWMISTSENRLQELRISQSEYTTLGQVTHFVNYCWPDYLSDVEANLNPYWQ